MTHWRKLTNPKYIGAYDFNPKEERILTIKSVQLEPVIGPDGKKEDCIVIHFTDSKPMVCNSTNAKAITKLHKTPEIEQWAGKQVCIYVAQVKAFGDVVDALRIRPTLPSKPVLNESHPKWDGAIKAVQEGKDAATFRTHFEVSDEDVIKLNEYKPKQ
jgi:ribosomal protein L31